IAWDQAMQDVRAILPQNHFHSWVEPVRLARVDGRQFTGGAYSTFGQEWLEKNNVGPLIAESLGKILGEPVTVTFAVV
ncbi:MAG TPA: DnaA N-terminal domain-containing protein, partial [Anaerolineaceae bacterium]